MIESKKSGSPIDFEIVLNSLLSTNGPTFEVIESPGNIIKEVHYPYDFDARFLVSIKNVPLIERWLASFADESLFKIDSRELVGYFEVRFEEDDHAYDCCFRSGNKFAFRIYPVDATRMRGTADELDAATTGLNSWAGVISRDDIMWHPKSPSQDTVEDIIAENVDRLDDPEFEKLFTACIVMGNTRPFLRPFPERFGPEDDRVS